MCRWSVQYPHDESPSILDVPSLTSWVTLDDLNALQSLGFTLPTPAYLLGVMLFSVIGFAAYRYGAKASFLTTKWLGIALMLYPYAISETWLLYLVGVGLCVSLYLFRK